MSSIRANITDAQKKFVAGSQQYRCANFLNPERVPNYVCPMGFRPDYKGNFDQSGYEIDHILEVAEGGGNDFSNLQALCLCCHEVKTKLYLMNRRNTQTNNTVDENEDIEEFVINEVQSALESARQRRSPGDMKYYLKDGQVILTKYNEKEYSGIYRREENCIEYDGKLYGSPGAFRDSVLASVGGVSSRSGRGWQTCYVRDESGEEILIGDLSPYQQGSQ